jgi:hypothetical protein
LRYLPGDPRFEAAVGELRRRAARLALISDTTRAAYQRRFLSWLTEGRAKTHALALLQRAPELFDEEAVSLLFMAAADAQDFKLAAAIKAHVEACNVPVSVSALNRCCLFSLAAQFPGSVEMAKKHLSISQTDAFILERHASIHLLRYTPTWRTSRIEAEGVRFMLANQLRISGRDYCPSRGVQEEPFNGIDWTVDPTAA